jgi:hypothetical protein
MSGYLFAYALGCASAVAAWWFWPVAKAAVAARFRRLADLVKEKLS